MHNTLVENTFDTTLNVRVQVRICSLRRTGFTPASGHLARLYGSPDVLNSRLDGASGPQLADGPVPIPGRGIRRCSKVLTWYIDMLR